MQLTATPPHQLTSGTHHHAFTSCAFFKETWYVAWRTAETHSPTPPGHITIHRTAHLLHDTPWAHATTLALTDSDADLRDPKLVATDDTLYCILGAYLPKYPQTSLSHRSSENLIQSFISYTHDGIYWAPLTPIGRPNYWIWSVLPLQKFWVAAAYHTGFPGEPSSVVLLTGTSLLSLLPSTTIYDGANLTKEDGNYRYPHATVAEPVLYQPGPNLLACALRSEDGDKCMELGISQYPYQNWRWWHTKEMIHPSSIVSTPYGHLLAGRELYKIGKQWHATTTIYALNAQVPTKLLRLPSAFDTGYAGLCPGPNPETFLCSYYSQNTTPAPYGYPLPGAHIFVSHLMLAP